MTADRAREVPDPSVYIVEKPAEPLRPGHADYERMQCLLEHPFDEETGADGVVRLSFKPRGSDRVRGVVCWPAPPDTPEADWCRSVVCLDCDEVIGLDWTHRASALYRDHVANGHDRRWEDARYTWNRAQFDLGGPGAWAVVLDGVFHVVRRESTPWFALYEIQLGDGSWALDEGRRVTFPSFEQALLALHVHQDVKGVKGDWRLPLGEPWLGRAVELLADLAVRRSPEVGSPSELSSRVELRQGMELWPVVGDAPLAVLVARAARDLHEVEGANLFETEVVISSFG